MWRSAGIAALVVAAVLLIPAGRAAAKTTVSVKGDVVTITVPVDCVGCEGEKGRGGVDLAKYWEKTAEDAWNAAFAKYPFCSKYKFKLDIKMTNVAPAAASDFGSHRLEATPADGRGFTGAGWGGAPESTPGGPADQRSTDGTRYYEFDAEGTMPADATPTVIIHEFGHVIGLGDDRDANGNAVGPDPKGIMVGGATGITPNTKLKITKNHVDRIGDQLANLGKIKCGQHWQGTLGGTASGSCFDVNGNVTDLVTYHGTIQIVVDKNGKTRGTIDMTTERVCAGVTDPQLSTGQQPLAVKKTGRGFEIAGFGEAGGPLVLAIRGTHASGTWIAPGGLSGSVAFELDCRSCSRG